MRENIFRHLFFWFFFWPESPYSILFSSSIHLLSYFIISFFFTSDLSLYHIFLSFRILTLFVCWWSDIYRLTQLQDTGNRTAMSIDICVSTIGYKMNIASMSMDVCASTIGCKVHWMCSQEHQSWVSWQFYIYVFQGWKDNLSFWFPSHSVSLYSQQERVSVPLSPHPCQH